MIISDQIGRELEISKPLDRIVSLVPSLTELLVYMGLEENIVGITKFCIHPEGLRKKKTIVGGTKKVHLDKFRALNPDIILCNKEENTLDMVLDLEKICPVHVSNVITFQDSLELILKYGDLFGKEQVADELFLELNAKKAIFEANLSSNKLRVAYFIWRKPWMVVAGNTFINSMLELNGWDNVYKDSKDRYPEIDLEQLKNKDLDLILLSSEPFPFQEKHIAEIQEHTNARIEIVNGEFFSWYGSRQLNSFKYFEEFQNHLSTPL
jgi:iron complex transport system substrate-binding protein